MLAVSFHTFFVIVLLCMADTFMLPTVCLQILNCNFYCKVPKCDGNKKTLQVYLLNALNVLPNIKCIALAFKVLAKY